MDYFIDENRVMTCTRIRNMASIVLASAYFATTWIGRNIKREVLAEHLARLGKRLGEVPEFAACVIADGGLNSEALGSHEAGGAGDGTRTRTSNT